VDRFFGRISTNGHKVWIIPQLERTWKERCTFPLAHIADKKHHHNGDAAPLNILDLLFWIIATTIDCEPHQFSESVGFEGASFAI
jgi:hypothetical protein